jgi:hypothetical protein
LRAAQRELEQLMIGPINQQTDARKYELAALIEKIVEQEEIHWNQRSRAN